MSNLEFTNHAGSSSVTVAEHSMPIREMYNLYNKQDSGFGISGYKVPVDYHDTRKLKAAREGNPKQKAPRATKHNDYLTETVKIASKLPGPIYNVVKPWVDEKKKNSAPKNVAKRTTYLQDIAEEAKRRPVPGPGAYDVLKQSEKKPAGIRGKGGERINCLNDAEYQAEASPGPGNYNPRPIAVKIRPAKLKPEEWRKKHKDEGGAKKVSLPDIGTYTPMAASFDTFDKIQQRSKSNKNGNPKSWGTDIRFNFEKKNKKVETAPGPGQYTVTATWGPDLLKGKKEGKHVNIFDKVSKGITTSIYYS